eukprot:1134762-Pelagomonas_calceolata.AAC.2
MEQSHTHTDTHARADTAARGCAAHAQADAWADCAVGCRAVPPRESCPLPLTHTEPACHDKAVSGRGQRTQPPKQQGFTFFDSLCSQGHGTHQTALGKQTVRLAAFLVSISMVLTSRQQHDRGSGSGLVSNC